MNKILIQKNFLDKLLIHWLGVFSCLIPLSFCFYTYDSANIKITLFYICSIGAFFIWLSSLIYRGQSVFTKKNFYTLLPVLIYSLYVLFSYIFKPYMAVRLESFTREFFCLALFLVIIFSFKEEDLKTILKYLFAGAWAVFIYGLLQIFNLDFLPWKGFWGSRVFASLANPNLFGTYILFILVLAFFYYLINRQKSLLVLFVLGMINLVFSQSKGALFALALCFFFGSMFFVYFFAYKYKEYRNKIIASGLVLALLAGCGVFYLGSKRFDSFAFRLSTWRASFDMIKASPLTGTGIGSFEIIYPAYKRPEIFYIENSPAVMSQHAENYYLEQLTSLGILGFGLFIWVLFYILKQVLFKLEVWSKEDRQKAYLLAGFSFASLAIYLHSLVDVTTYFASTMFLLTLSNGAIFNLAFGPFENKNISLKSDNKLVFKIIFALTVLILAGIYFYIQKIFWTQFVSYNFNNQLQIFYCVMFLIISIAVLLLFIFLMLKTKKTAVCLFMILAGLCCFLNWQQFISNVNFSRATGLAERGRIEALEYYTRTINQNPTFYPAWHFRGLMLANRFSLTEKNDIAAGDNKGEINTDFKRALRDFNKTKQLAPNAALLDYNIGSLYLKYAGIERDFNNKKVLYDLASESFIKAWILNPIDENVYYQLANVELAQGKKTNALFWLAEYLKGPKDVLNQDYLKRHSENKKATEIFTRLGGKI